jgi:hypothetical protein
VFSTEITIKTNWKRGEFRVLLLFSKVKKWKFVKDSNLPIW